MSKASGKKRASPGGDIKEENSTAVESLSDEQVKLLEDSQKELERVELYLALYSVKYLQPTYNKRRETLKKIPQFWPTALYHHQVFELQATHAADRDAITFLDELWVERNAIEPRAYQIEFHFKENPYFSNKVLIKDYKYISPPNMDNTADEDGVTAAQKDFKEERDIQPQAYSIEWKNDTKNLVKMYPRKTDAEDDDEMQDEGSFFNWFTEAGDEYGIGAYVLDVYENAVQYFFGRMDELGDEDVTDSDEEDEEAGDEEIDLEQPKKKARKA